MTRHHPPCFRLSLCVFVLLAGMLFSCRPSLPAGILSEGKLEDVLYDYNLALSLADNVLADEVADRESLRYQYAQRVFLDHGISEAEFDSSMVWYSAEGKRLSEIFRRINERLEAEAKTLGVGMSETELYSNYGIDGDTANVWNGTKILFLTNRQPDNLRVITLPIDSLYLPGDKYKLSFDARFLPERGSHNVYALFSVMYSDSSVVSQTQCIGGDYKCTLNLEPNARQDTLLPERISLTLFAPPFTQDTHTQVFCMTYPSVLRIHSPREARTEENGREAMPTDSLTQTTDSLALDSLDLPAAERRLTPLEERDMREQRHDIKIVKERITKPSQRPQVRRRMR